MELTKLLTGRRTIAEISIEARALVDMLIDVKPGDEITYDEMTKAIGRDVRTVARGAMQTARRVAERQYRMVFSPIFGVGLRRLLNDDIPGVADSKIAHIRRTATRAARTLACVDFDRLPNEKRIEHNAKLSILGAITLSSSQQAQTLVSQKSQAGPLPVGRVLELIQGK